MGENGKQNKTTEAGGEIERVVKMKRMEKSWDWQSRSD